MFCFERLWDVSERRYRNLEWSSDELARNFLDRRIVEFIVLLLTSPGAPTTSFVISMLLYA